MESTRTRLVVMCTIASAVLSAILLTEGLEAMFAGFDLSSGTDGSSGSPGNTIGAFAFQYGPGFAFGLAIAVVLRTRSLSWGRIAGWVVASMIAWRVVLEIVLSSMSGTFSDGDAGPGLGQAIQQLVIPGLIGAALVTVARDLLVGRSLSGSRIARIAGLGAAAGLAMYLVSSTVENGGTLMFMLMFALWQVTVGLGLETLWQPTEPATASANDANHQDPPAFEPLNPPTSPQ